MTFDLTGDDTVRIEQLQTKYGTYIGFWLPDEIPYPSRVKFENRSLNYTCYDDIRAITLDAFVLRILDWKEGDELGWKVYSDRTDFFKRNP